MKLINYLIIYSILVINVALSKDKPPFKNILVLDNPKIYKEIIFQDREGNKIDLKPCKDTWKFPYVYISCKTGENVSKVMQLLRPILLKISPPETWYEYCQRFEICLIQ